MALRDMLTESEAKTKWCPLYRHNDIEDEVRGGSNCIASDCAFWRWSHQDHNGIPTGFCGGATLPKYI